MSKSFNTLKMLKKEKKFYVFDVETWGLDARPESFALGVIYGENYIFKTESVDELREKLLDPIFNGAIIFAHNAIYDLSTVFGNIITDLDNNTVFNNSTFILSKYDRITFADSLNILPTSVEKIGEMNGEPKGKTPEKFKTGKRAKISKKDFDYCEQDCAIIYNALDNLFKEIGCIRLTLASLSMAYFRRKHLEFPIYYDEKIYRFFDSYYGGRVECFRLGSVYAQKFDINSMYPYAMATTKFPNPDKLKNISEPTLQKLLYCLTYEEGMATIKVKHKEHYYGFLPYRTKSKLLFPYGIFSGTWNFNEIRLALKHGIIEILEITEILSAPAMDSPFKSFVNDLYTKRKTTKNEFEKYLYKIILNSLYGKFAQRKKYKTKYVTNVHEHNLKDEDQIIPFNNTRTDAYIVTPEDYFSYNTLPLFSSYITSSARCQLLELMVKYIDNDIVYVDTDSIAVNNYTKEIETSNELGAFKLEDKIIINILGNKSYEEKDGNLVLKGIRKNSKRNADGTFSYKRMIKPKSALRRNMQAGIFINETKKISTKYDKRKVYLDGSTSPIKLGNEQGRGTNFITGL